MKSRIWSLETKLERVSKAQAEEAEQWAAEERELAEGKELLYQLSGRWYQHCSAWERQVGFLPLIYEIRVVNDRLEMALGSRPLQQWGDWKTYPYDPATRTISLDYENEPIQVISSDYMRQEFATGEKCEWRRE